MPLARIMHESPAAIVEMVMPRGNQRGLDLRRTLSVGRRASWSLAY
jgi:hypothetical protein